MLTLTPEAAYSCLGERVIFTCVVNIGDKMKWNVEYSDPSWTDIRQRISSSTNEPGIPILAVNNVGHRFEFTLTSRSPLTSTATTNITSELSGTLVYCVDETSVQATSEIQIVNGKAIVKNICKQNVFKIRVEGEGL